MAPFAGSLGLRAAHLRHFDGGAVTEAEFLLARSGQGAGIDRSILWLIVAD